MGPVLPIQDLHWLLDVTRKYLACRSLNSLYTDIIDDCITLCDAKRGILFLQDSETSVLVQCCARNAQGHTIEPIETIITQTAQRTMREGEALVERSTRRPRPESGDMPPTAVVLSAPISDHARTIGAIYLDGLTETFLDKHSQYTTLLQLYGRQLAPIIANIQRLEHAHNDALTGLPNTNFFLQELSKTLDVSNDEHPGGILLLDLDAFKRVNHAAGAETGDRALTDVARTLEEILRADGFVARYGSDKFAILLPPDRDVPMPLRMRDVAERARASIGAKSYHGIRLSVSIGGLSFPHNTTAQQPAELIATADDLLATARRRGPNQVEIR